MNEKENATASTHNEEVSDCEPETPALPAEVLADLIHLAGHIATVPMILFAMVDRDKHWLKTDQGLALREVPREISACGLIYADKAPLLIPDTREHDYFKDNPAMMDGLSIRFFGGFPLTTAKHLRLGTMILLDTKPRTLSEAVQGSLVHLASLVVNALETQKENLYLNNVLRVAEAENLRKRITFKGFAKELIQPLSVIAGSAEYILQTVESEKLHHKPLNFLCQGVNQALQMLNHTLTYHNLTAGEGQVVKRQFSLRKLVASLIQARRILAEKQNNTLNLMVAEKVPPEFQGDASRLSQLLWNLIDHSNQTTRDGHIDMTVQCGTLRQFPLMVYFSLTSRGTKSPPINGPLSQNLLESLTEKHEEKVAGNSIQVEIARYLTDILGGSLSVESLDQGTQISLVLPLSLSEKKASYWETTISLTVLLGCKDPVTEVLVTRYLHDLGHKTMITGQIEELTDLYLRKEVDAVIMDHSLGRESFFHAAELIQTYQKGHKGNKPFIALVSEPDQAQRLRDFGLWHHMVNPVTREGLAQALHQTICGEVGEV